MSRYINYEKLYEKYIAEYNQEKQDKLEKGYGEMYKKKLSKSEFKFNVNHMRDSGIQPAKAVRQLVSEEKFKYSFKTGKRWKKAGLEYGGGWAKNYRIKDLQNAEVDLSAINDMLKEKGVKSGKERAKIIGEEFFGVDPITGKSP